MKGGYEGTRVTQDHGSERLRRGYTTMLVLEIDCVCGGGCGRTFASIPFELHTELDHATPQELTDMLVMLHSKPHVVWYQA